MFYWTGAKSSAMSFNGEPFPQGYIFEQGHLPGFLSMFPPTIDGDGMIMGAELGAQIRTIRNNLAVFLGFNIPGKHQGEEPLFRIVGISEMFCPHTMVVNRDGQRFAD